MSTTVTESRASAFEARLANALLRRAIEDLTTVIDRPFSVQEPHVARVDRRAAGEGAVHISFKWEFLCDGKGRHGALLMPLPEAISLACYLMMVPDEGVAEHRKEKDLDRSLKDAMLEIGNFIGGAADAALRALYPKGSVSARSRGCQGVRAGVRPAFPYQEGDPLLLVRAKAQIHQFKEFELLAMVPVLPEA
jgi:hypothetical protein